VLSEQVSSDTLSVWNLLLNDLRDPECSADTFRLSLKTFLFSQY